MLNIAKEIVEKLRTGKDVTVEEIKPLLRPEGIQNGVMVVDPEKCSSCGLCIMNCPFKCWVMNENKIPQLKDDYSCFSCCNCQVACPKQAISVAKAYGAQTGSFFDTGFPPLKMPEEPKDSNGNSAKWTEVEKTIFNRRSVRNFKDDPVPESLIRRVLEAGRFAPSAGNHQPWKFTVVTNKEFIAQLEEACYQVNTGLFDLYMNNDTLPTFLSVLGKPIPVAIFDYRVMIGGFRSVARKELPIFLNAPCVIFIGGNWKLGFPDLHIGICVENMNLTAISLGLGFCWSNFGKEINNVPELKAKLGFDEDWRVISTAVIGYPKFKQSGVVPRMSRPVTWFRPGSNEPQIEE